VIKLLKLFLILGALDVIVTSLTKLGINIASFLIIIVGILICCFIWKGLDNLASHPETPNESWKLKLLRWIAVFYFSTVAVEIGIIFAFLLRFFLDPVVTFKNQLMSAVYSEVVIILVPLFVALPLIYWLSKAFKFSNPLRVSLIIFIIWQLFFHLPKLLGI